MKATFALAALSMMFGASALAQGAMTKGEPKIDEAVMKQMMQKTKAAMQAHRAFIEQYLMGWPEKTKEVAAVTIEAHGKPAAVTADMLVWGRSGPFKRMILYREEVAHEFPMPHLDVLEQTIDYPVAADKLDELARYDGSVLAFVTGGELAARCDKQEANLLALNLAYDVAEGKKTVDQAREYYANAIRDLLQGKLDPYLKELKFEQRPKAGYPDKARFPNPMMQKQALRP